MPPDAAPTNDPLRVVLLDSIPGWGGGETWCLEAGAALRARGHSVEIAAARNSELARRARAAGFGTWELSTSAWSAPSSAWALGARLRDRAIDVVVANIGRDVRMAALACSRSNTAVVQRRGIARPIKRDALTRWIYRTRVRRVIANCAAIRDEMLGDGSVICPERFVIVPNGVRPTPDGDRRLAREELQLPSETPVVLVVGRLAPMKGHAHLLRAWPAVRERLADATLVLAGDGEIRDELQALARQLGIDDSVRWVGFVKELANLHAAADVFALPSVRDEGCSNALLEAMSHGLPSVVSDCGGLPETVVHGATGLVTPRGDEGALTEALVHLLSDAELRRRMGDAARTRASEVYSVERVTQQLEQVLRAARDERRAANAT